MRLRGRHYRTGQQVELTCGDGHVTSIGPPTLEPVDFEAAWIAPGFCDIEVREFAGVSFDAIASPEQLTIVVEALAVHGVTQFLPAVSAHASASLPIVADAIANDAALAARIPGIHLVKPRNWAEIKELQDLSGNRIRIVSLAAELPQSKALVGKLNAAGILTCLIDSAAKQDQVLAVISAGARLSMRLASDWENERNGASTAFWDQLADQSLWIGIRGGGHRFPQSVFRSVLRAKTPSRCVMVAESNAETAVLDDCISRTATIGGVGLADAIDMASWRPRELVGLPAAGLDVGCAMDFVLFDWDEKKLEVRQVVKR